MKHCLLILLTFAVFVNVGTISAQDAKPFKVIGSIDTVPNASYYVSYYSNDSLRYDTISLDEKRRFVLSGLISEPASVSLYVDNVYDKNRLGDWLCYSFWVEPDKETYFKGLRGFRKQIVRNSETQRLDDELDREKAPLNKQLAFLRKKFRSDNYTAEDKRAFDSLTRERDALNFQFIEDHPNTHYAASLLAGYVHHEPSFYARSQRLFDQLTPEIRSTKRGKRIQELLSKQRSVQLGEQLTDFTLADTAGNTISLSDYKGKYLLVEFWASWCVPCRRENPNLVKSYNTYKPSGFEILAVSFDDKRDNWVKAINDDGLPWTHVSELTELFNSPLAKKLLVRSVPDNFLLDREGKIIGRNLRGDELNRKLSILTLSD